MASTRQYTPDDGCSWGLFLGHQRSENDGSKAELPPALWDGKVVRMDTSIIQLQKLVGEYRFHLGELTTEIRIKLWEDVEGKRGLIWFTQSHHMHTPTQAGAYHTSRPCAEEADGALRQAIFGFQQYYDSAVAENHNPAESWLVPNEDF